MNKKTVVLIVILFTIVLLGLGIYFIAGNAQKSAVQNVTFDSPENAATGFITYISQEKYNQAYSITRTSSIAKADFAEYMSRIKESVSLDTCQYSTLKSSGSSALVEAVCPYKDQALTRSMRVVFSTETSNAGKAQISSYDISYL